ncbi:MAG: class I SAM-dependent methyltransferase [Firmicutes bacterium]|nr:class I SAM-dependent methyltransferase [Bacillota bacterium]
MKIDEYVKRSSSHFQLDGLSPRDFIPLTNRLRQAGYNETDVFHRLGVNDIEGVMARTLPVFLRMKLKENTHLDRLIRLFLLSRRVNRAEIEDIFEKTEIEFYKKIGLFDEDETGIFSPVDLFPCQGGFFATDHFFTMTFLPRHVYPLGVDSYRLARGMIDSPCGRVLDLCTGSGIQGILASRFANEVYCVDINPRAVNFAKFNALLNQAENVRVLQGDLYSAVKGMKFDRIFSNPPFVPSPEGRLFFRDGDVTGESVMERIISGFPEHLNDGCYAQIVTLMVFMENQDYCSKLDTWLNSNPYHILALNARNIEPSDFIFGHINTDATFEAYSEKLVQWFESYEENKIVKLADALINFKKSASSQKLHRIMEINTLKERFGSNIITFLDTADLAIDDNAHPGFENEMFCISDDVEYHWEAKGKGGAAKYGVLFKPERLFFNENVDQFQSVLLSILGDNKIGNSELKQLFSDQTSGIGSIPDFTYEDAIRELLMRGIIETV